MKREPVSHHYWSVPQNTVTEILKNLKRLTEDMRLMYLHLWCLGLRLNEVCSIKREGYYVKEGGAWLRIYQHKMKMEKVIPIPMMLYRVVMVYVERKGIASDFYVFPNSKGGPYSSTHYWHEMVEMQWKAVWVNREIKTASVRGGKGRGSVWRDSNVSEGPQERWKRLRISDHGPHSRYRREDKRREEETVSNGRILTVIKSRMI